jgi:hypothetical protein
MKPSLIVLVASIVIFVIVWAASLTGSSSFLFFFLVYLAFFLAIISVYLKVNELGQKTVTHHGTPSQITQ